MYVCVCFSAFTHMEKADIYIHKYVNSSVMELKS